MEDKIKDLLARLKAASEAIDYGEIDKVKNEIYAEEVKLNAATREQAGANAKRLVELELERYERDVEYQSVLAQRHQDWIDECWRSAVYRDRALGLSNRLVEALERIAAKHG